MTAITDLDLINADLMNEAIPNAFGREAQPGDELAGVLVAVERRHRHDNQGQPLYWVDRKPSPIEAGPAVIDNVLIWQTDVDPDDQDDDGRRSLRLDPDVKQALSEAIRAAGVDGVALGGRIDGFKLVSQAAKGRYYSGGTYTPPPAA
ncbi:hypothetical protein IU500_08390 [Nocardia terpenica]|uniref:hypothetical protein n=1 Tax=Nocardia terpenica TaxID=455432 RepID=UPI001895DB2B|nr:hypothetical protein [Nocardia terpenica]MBF6060795.1 hypothetical protein [Nocardia terpenica]MBF6104055.1 hypothetical protein [Nocardia terpenica]MBF6111571.1 hypothetical protein [Nocardia terpenica]MBF6118276.1 hypothetical protein [Nocardia terpenica]MBF6156099.1 hypothetical protein [Nocardia terpenica]